MDLSSRYCEHVTCPNLYDDPAGLVRALIDFAVAQGTRPVLFAASDGSAQFIADHEARLRDHYRLTTPGKDCLDRTQNKRRLIEVARAAGIPTPETHFPEAPSELPAIASTVTYPVILKPLYSPDWKRQEIVDAIGRVKALRVEEPAVLRVVGTQLLELGSTFMIQEIVPGPTENLLTFLGCMDGSGAVLTGCLRRKLRQYPPGFGYCTLTESVRNPLVLESSLKLFQALGYTGIGCAEFKIDARDGQPRLIEINARAVRTSQLAISAGADFPWLAYQEALEPGTVEPVLDYRDGVVWIHLRDELWAATREMFRGELNPLRWVGSLVGKPVVLPAFSRDDPGPGLLAVTELLKRVAQLPRGILKRSSSRSEPLPQAAEQS